MRSKPLNRSNAARARRDPALSPPPSGRRPNRTNQVVTGLVLLAFGAVVALSVDRLAPAGNGAGASASPAASDLATLDPNASPLTDSTIPPTAGPTDAPTPSPSPASAVLESLLPTVVNGTELTITSAKGTSALGNGPTTRALAAAITGAGKSPDDLELGYAYDAAGENAMTILAFRLPGVDPAKLQTIVLDSLLVANTPGVKISTVTLSGTTVTKVDYGDEAAFEYVFTRGDSVFVIETTDEAMAAAAIAAMPAAAAQPSPGASAAASAPASAPASPQATPAPSASPSP